MDSSLLGAALVPHPPVIFPEVGGAESEQVQDTRKALRDLSGWLSRLEPDVLIIISPHGPAKPGTVVSMGGDRVRASLAHFGAPDLCVSLEIDGHLRRCIGEAAEEKGIAWEVDDAWGGRVDHGISVPLLALLDGDVELPVVCMGYPAMGIDDLRRLGSSLVAGACEAGRRVVLLASGDLSHRLSPDAPAGFHPRAAEFDRSIVQAFRRGDTGVLWNISPRIVESAGECGYSPLLVALAAADVSHPGSIPILHSYEAPFGVGYAVATLTPKEAIGYLDPASLARVALRYHFEAGEHMPQPQPLSRDLGRSAGCFVTIHKGGHLRGCIGTIEPMSKTLAAEIIRNTASAAFRDPRFPPLGDRELGDVEITVDVLSETEPAGVEDLDPNRFGVVVARGSQKGVLLPGIPGIDTVDEQVRIASQKARIDPGDPALEIFRFEVTRHGPA